LAPHDVGARVVLLGQQLRGDDAGRIAHPLDFDLGHRLLDRGLELGELVGFDGGVDQKVGLGHGAGAEAEHHQAAGNDRGQPFKEIRQHE